MDAKTLQGRAMKRSWRPIYSPETRRVQQTASQRHDSAIENLFHGERYEKFPCAVRAMSSSNLFVDILPYMSVLRKVGLRWPERNDDFLKLLWEIGYYSAPGVMLERRKHGTVDEDAEETRDKFVRRIDDNHHRSVESLQIDESPDHNEVLLMDDIE